MEVSLLGCLSHVQPEKLQPCENSSFILVDANPVVNCVIVSENKPNVSTSLENLKLKPVQDDLFQCSPQNCCDNLILANKSKEADCDTKMRVEVEDVVLDPVPAAAEVVSHVNGSISSENAACSNESSLQPALDAYSASEASTSVSNVNLSANDACFEDSNTSSAVSPKKRKRYLFNFRPSLGKILVKTKSGNSYKCYTCGGIYRQKFSLKRHFLRTHIDYRYISEADVANCKIPVPSYIAQHSNSENTTNGRKKFKKSSDDVFLENNDSGLLPGLYRCHDCTDISFNSDAELREHYNSHPDSIKKKYECEICQASFIKQQILSRHLAGHEGKKIKLLCKKCNMEFASKEELDKHLSTHASGKTCRICEKVLSNVANRKRHERLHLNRGKRCPHCDQCFAQRKELERHVKSQHAEPSRTCNVCNQICSSVESLALHMKEKHRSSPKLPDNTNASDSVPKPKPNPITKICFVCKKVFPTVYAMLKHRRNAHPFHSRRKRHKKTARAKIVIGNEESGGNEYKKTYARPGRPKGSGKKIAANGVKCDKKSRETENKQAKKEEIEFYCRVHENIAYNLTNCIEGKASQLSLKEYNFNDLQQLSGDFEECIKRPWEFYNFPSWYDVKNVLKMKGREIKRPENLSVADEFLHNAAGLFPTNLSNNHCIQTKQNSASVNVMISNNECNYSKNLSPDKKKNFIEKEVISVLVCNVCKERLDSREAFAEHCINNHPNVVCSYVEFIGDKESPPIIPPEMCKNDISPAGFRFAYDVPPIIRKAPVTCTKCRKLFRSVSELHEHIVVCGNLIYSQPRHRFKIPCSSEHTMRKRMTMAQFRSGFNNRSGNTPEKRLGFLKKVAKSFRDKQSRSDKLLFYKNGRLQPKSFKIDKNYFNTKPKPVKSGLSKRGRKSYEEKSLAYRYASMQPSTSRECPHCRKVFASIQLLNNHNKTLCNQMSMKKKNAVTASNSPIKSASGNASVTKNITEKKMGSNSKSAVCNLTTLFAFHSSSSSGISSEDLSFQSHETSQNKNTESSNIPMDLSRNSSDNNESTSSLLVSSHTNASIAKSAVQIAIEAVQKHITELPNIDEPISKLQQITEKLVINKSPAKSPLVSPVLKSGTGKKVGRPRKLKKETSTPILVQKEVTDKKSPSKPRKLEEIVKDIKQSKVRGDDEGLHKSECSEQTSVSEINVVRSPPSSVSSINQSESQQKIDNKDKDKNTVADKNIKQNIFDSCTVDNNISNKSADLSIKFSAISNINKTSSKFNELPTLKLPENIQIHNVAPIPQSSVTRRDDNDTEIRKALCENKVTENNSSLDTKAPGKLDTASQDANSHGRSSPTSDFECLLKSINQRLLSEDKNQQDESAIPWLEDEKFEIPPSRTSLNVIVKPAAEKIPIKTGSGIITPIISTTKDILTKEQPNLPSTEQVIHGTNQELQIKRITLNNEEQKKATSIDNISHQIEIKFMKEKANKEIRKTTADDNIILPKITKMDHADKSALMRKKLPSSLNSKSFTVSKDHKAVASPSYQKSFTETRKSPVTPPKRKIDSKTVKSTPNSAEKRRPGRPRKKPIEEPELNKMVTNIPSAGVNVKLTNNQSAKNILPAEDNKLLKSSDASLRISSSDLNPSGNERNSSPSLLEPVPLTMGNSSPVSSANSVESDKSLNKGPVESETSESLKTFGLKSKPFPNSDSGNLKIFKSTTTEFGKNLASKMKEKMRLSLEQELPKITHSTDDVNQSNCGSEISETNSLMNNEEKLIKVIKKECESAENQKIHFCPYCMLEFAYLTNFRRHIKQCKARDQAKESEPVLGTATTNLQYLPKKDEVDYCMLNLYRFQSRQTDMLKEDENANKHIKTYECNICHKIYLNLFNLIQHKLSSHKLVEQNNPGCSSEINEMNILSLAGHLTQESSHPENESGNVDGNIRLNALTNILGDFQKPINVQNSNDGDNHNETQCGKLEKQLAASNQSPKPQEVGVKVKKQSDKSAIHFVNLHSKNKPNHETVVKEKSKNNSSSGILNHPDSNKNLSSESSLVKRKRGRPVGWRKNPDAVPETIVKNKKIIADNLLSLKKILKLKKKGELQQLQIEQLQYSNTKFKPGTKRIINNMKKIITKKESKNILNDEKPSIETASMKNVPDEKINVQPSANKLPIFEDGLKNEQKRPSLKGTTETGDVPSSINAVSEVKSSLKILEKFPIKTEKPSDDAKVNNMKRGRGRPPWKNLLVKNSKSDIFPKRRPGRPPKTLLSSTNSPHSLKMGIASSSNAKNSKRTIPVLPLSIDSSDSDSSDVKNEPHMKKKIHLKCCALCSDKFVSSLELKRHTQLKHNRRKIEDSKSELQRKIIKKFDSKSSSADVSECETDISTKRCESPQRKQNQITPTRKSDVGKSSPRTSQMRKTEPNLIPAQSSPTTSLSKSPPSDAIERDKNVSPKRCDSPQKNLKICAICKQKFLNGALLLQHLQMFHNRKSEAAAVVSPERPSTPGRKSQPVAVKSSPPSASSSSSSSSSSPMKKKKELSFERRSLSRQCRKPLPPLKRPRIKKEPIEQIHRKPKL